MDNNETLRSQLLNVLSEGENDARQLSLQSNYEHFQTAVMNLQNKFNQAIVIASSMEDAAGMRQMQSHSHRMGSGSPGGSRSGSPKSDASERTSRKRKDTVKRRVKVPCTTPNSGPLDAALPPEDGYSWRKYGQKNILNSKNPRSYYRCTYQKTQNCPATKQVQRSDEDPAFCDVTYQDEHTCTHQPGQTSLAQSLERQLLIPAQNESNEQQLMINFEHRYPAELEVHESYQEEHDTILSPPSISSAQAGRWSENPNMFSPSGTSFAGPFSPGFGSSGASNSNYYSVYQTEFGGDFGGVSDFHGSEFGFGSDVMPMPHSDTSAINGFTDDQSDYPFNPSSHHYK